MRNPIPGEEGQLDSVDRGACDSVTRAIDQTWTLKAKCYLRNILRTRQALQSGLILASCGKNAGVSSFLSHLPETWQVRGIKQASCVQKRQSQREESLGRALLSTAGRAEIWVGIAAFEERAKGRKGIQAH